MLMMRTYKKQIIPTRALITAFVAALIGLSNQAFAESEFEATSFEQLGIANGNELSNNSLSEISGLGIEAQKLAHDDTQLAVILWDENNKSKHSQQTESIAEGNTNIQSVTLTVSW
jgi:hypothetical protein